MDGWPVLLRPEEPRLQHANFTVHRGSWRIRRGRRLTVGEQVRLPAHELQADGHALGLRRPAILGRDEDQHSSSTSAWCRHASSTSARAASTTTSASTTSSRDKFFMYAPVATGFQSAGVTPRVFTVGQIQALDGEEVDELRDRARSSTCSIAALRVNSDVFYMDYAPRLVRRHWRPSASPRIRLGSGPAVLPGPGRPVSGGHAARAGTDRHQPLVLLSERAGRR